MLCSRCNVDVWALSNGVCNYCIAQDHGGVIEYMVKFSLQGEHTSFSFNINGEPINPSFRQDHVSLASVWPLKEEKPVFRGWINGGSVICNLPTVDVDGSKDRSEQLRTIITSLVKHLNSCQISRTINCKCGNSIDVDSKDVYHCGPRLYCTTCSEAAKGEPRCNFCKHPYSFCICR